MENQKAKRAQALQVEKCLKEQTQNRKDTPENYPTNIRKTRDTGAEAMVKTIHTVH